MTEGTRGASRRSWVVVTGIAALLLVLDASRPAAAAAPNQSAAGTAPTITATAPTIMPSLDTMMPPRTVRSFYGWQILATAEVGGAMAAASIALPDKPFNGFMPTAGFLLGIPLYALGGPVAHWSHGDFQKGLVSLAGNVAFPILGGLVGGALSCGRQGAPDDCRAHGFADGAAIGLILAPIVDAALLGWEDVPADMVGKRKDPKRFSLAPLLKFPRGGMLAGVTGRF
jgi:hypothetical protein